MTTPTTAEVGHGSKGPTLVEIHGFRGRLISAEHADYDIARAVWNGAIDRRPRLIARCIGTADVVAAVRFARDHDLEIAIRGGGHNVAGTAVCDDGIVIDLSAMRAVRVDPAEPSGSLSLFNTLCPTGTVNCTLPTVLYPLSLRAMGVVFTDPPTRVVLASMVSPKATLSALASPLLVTVTV